MKNCFRGTRSSRVGLLAGIVLLSLSGAWNAKADVITQTQDIDLWVSVTMSTSLTDTPLSVSATLNKTLLFDEFDPSLGTLDAVEIVVDSAGTNAGTLALTTGGQQTSASFQISDTEQVAFAIPSLLSVTATYPIPFPLSVSFTSSIDNTLTFSTSHLTFLSIGLSGSTYLPFFIGTDTFGIDFSLMMTSVFTLLQGGSATLQFLTAWDPLTDDPGVTVTYLYTPAQVSEPASLALLLIGLAALPFWRRRVRGNSATVP